MMELDVEVCPICGERKDEEQRVCEVCECGAGC